jgi:membrane glycosyltransferase
MDAVIEAADSPPLAPADSPALPPERPLVMPVQDFDMPPAERRALAIPPNVRLRRLFILTGTLALTAVAAWEMYLVLQVAGVTVLEYVTLALFAILFAWVAFSFVTNFAGFARLMFGRGKAEFVDVEGPLPGLATRTALLFPVYNEDPVRVIARVQAMIESVAEAGTADAFDVFILSDTTRPDVWIAEEAAFLQLRERVTGARIYYRHRRRNTGRKAGNIADWVTRFGGGYDFMVVLDADSLMSGDTLVRLAAAMERHPGVGLIQTLPVIVNGGTTFARMQQFANRLYGSLIGYGLAWWHGTESNYWGHNAIIRTRAFAAHAGLPALPGRKPVGGEIMSHDFVEAALMRRAGWAIRIEPRLGGSYEETPPALSDYAVRDRRWCQGNIQHLGVLPARGLHPLSRLHLITGIAAYVTAPLWLVFLLIGILIALQAQFIRPEYFPGGFVLFPQWPAQDPVRAAWVFGGTMGLLLAPKLLAWLALLWRNHERRGFGGGLRTFAGMLVETVIAGLIAPVMMLNQSMTVLAAAVGRDAGWNVQRRDDGALAWRDVARGYGWHTAFGLLLGLAAWLVSGWLLLWMTPVVLGLVLAIPLAALTADPMLGRVLQRAGLLAVPEERQPPAILARANALVPVAQETLGEGDAIARLLGDPDLLAAHRAMIEQRPRRRGDIDADLVLGMARLEEADSVDEARRLLSPAELAAVLADSRGLGRLLALAPAAEQPVDSTSRTRHGIG